MPIGSLIETSSLTVQQLLHKPDKITVLKDHPLSEFGLMLLDQRPRDSKDSENKEDM